MSEAKKLARILRRFLPVDRGCLVSWWRSASLRIPRRKEVENHSVRGTGHKSRKPWIFQCHHRHWIPHCTGKVTKSTSIALYYISLDWDQNRNPNENNREHQVGRSTTKAPATEAGSRASDRARALPGSFSPPRSLSHCKISSCCSVISMDQFDYILKKPSITTASSSNTRMESTFEGSTGRAALEFLSTFGGPCQRCLHLHMVLESIFFASF